MKKQIFLFCIIISCMGIYAQNDCYYYYKGEKQHLTLDKTKLNITTSTVFQKESLNGLTLKIVDFEKDQTTSNIMLGNVTLETNDDKLEYDQIVNSLKKNKDIIAVHPNFITLENQEIGMSSYFYVRLKNEADYNLLNKIAIQKNVRIVEQIKFLSLWYTLQCTKETPDNTLDIANYFYETELFASAVPDFLSDDLFCTNDPNFSQLWGLSNTSYPNIDIKACSAWGISRGAGITVAVLDEGIELTHMDLSSNISLLSYDTESNTSPSQIFGNHGTHCAGTIGAIRNNNIQIVGVAPECTLMSVSNSLSSTPNSRIKRGAGINWAWKQGADIISNSWGSSVQYDAIDEAIDSALVYGRGGKGSIVVFSSGNGYGAVSYPANSNSSIIAVGAINKDGSRASFSNYGTTLDLVAPGVDILSTIQNNATELMSGTSMACPHVAGVAALVLSVNPNLTGLQVRNIIESTTQKVGGYSYLTTPGRSNGIWNTQMGYGLVDAYAAVQAASSSCVNDYTNQTVTSNTTVIGCNNLNVQNVTVQNNAKLKLDAPGEITINGSFEVALGSELEIK